MSKSTGTIIKYIAIFVIIALLVGLGIWKVFLNGKTIETDSTPKNPQCSDGIDNDGDGFVDMDDENCSSPDDNWERDLSWLKWVFGAIIVLGIIFGVWYFISKSKDKDDDEGILPEPVKPQRAYELAISSLLKYKFKDIPSRVIIEKDGYEIFQTMEEDVIEEDDRFLHVDRTTGETFQFVFIRVNEGKWAGQHMIAYHLSKGEEFIKGGLPRFESHQWIGNWSKKARTFNMSSPQGEKARLELIKLEALRDGDKETLAESQSLLSSLGSSSSSGSAFVDEDDEEYRERMKLLHSQNNTKKKGKTKRNTNTNTPEMNFDGGDEE